MKLWLIACFVQILVQFCRSFSFKSLINPHNFIRKCLREKTQRFITKLNRTNSYFFSNMRRLGQLEKIRRFFWQTNITEVLGYENPRSPWDTEWLNNSTCMQSPSHLPSQILQFPRPKQELSENWVIQRNYWEQLPTNSWYRDLEETDIHYWFLKWACCRLQDINTVCL